MKTINRFRVFFWESNKALVNVVLRTAVLAAIGLVVFVAIYTINKAERTSGKVLDALLAHNEDVLRHKQEMIDHEERSEDSRRQLENLICDIIIKRPAAQVSDGQRKACQGKGTQ
jgi:hypothetical protein